MDRETRESCLVWLGLTGAWFAAVWVQVYWGWNAGLVYVLIVGFATWRLTRDR